MTLPPEGPKAISGEVAVDSGDCARQSNDEGPVSVYAAEPDPPSPSIARRGVDPMGSRGFAHVYRPTRTKRTLCPGQVRRTKVGGWKCSHCRARSRTDSIAEPPEQHRERVRSPYWTINYYANGKHHYVATGSTERTHAEIVRKKILGEVWGGKRPWLATEEPTLLDLLNLVRAHYQLNELRSQRQLEVRIKALLAFRDANLGETRVSKLDESYWLKYAAWRKKSGMANGTINRELQAIRQAFRIAMKRRHSDGRPLVERAPSIDLLREAPPRERFAEEYEVVALLKALRSRELDDVADLVECYALTGRRNAEPRALKWEHVNWFTKVILFERTKNRRPHEIPFSEMPELEELLKRRRKLTDKLEAETGERCDWVFHRAGNPIVRFERAWRVACADAGIPATGTRKLTPHDFRRRQARDVMEATGDPMLAADLVGWESLAMLKRYRIISPKDRAGALSKVRKLRMEKRAEQEEAIAGRVNEG